MKLPSATSRSQAVQDLLHRNVELADRDDDLDMDPLTAAAWENVTRVGNGTINWNAVFGVPANAIGVFIRTSGAHTGPVTFILQAKVTTTNASFVTSTQVNGVGIYTHGLVPIAADGTSYYAFLAAWGMFYLRVVGWITP